MQNLIAALPPGSRVLDLGAGAASFRTDRDDLTIVRLDIEIRPERAPGSYVAADAARLPFRAGVFDLIVSNHSLEHFPELEATLKEVGRTVKPGGAFYVAVPDVTTFTDRVYRWMGRGGGHVNGFRSADEVMKPVERFTGLPLRGQRDLFSSLSFLNRHNRRGRPQIKSVLFAFGNERFLAILSWVLRRMDRRFGTRWSKYGWSFYFGNVNMPGGPKGWANVCVRCGSGFAQRYLKRLGAIQPLPDRFEWYRCPNCGARNLLFEVDEFDPWE